MGRRRKTDKHLPECMYLKSGTYYLVKNNVWINLGKNRRDAFLKYDELMSDPSRGLFMRDLFRRYELEILPKYSPATQENQGYSLQALSLVFGKHSPHFIKPSDVYKYIDKRSEYSKNWANKDKAVLSNVFQNAIRWGTVEFNPCKEVKGFDIPSRTREVTQSEFEAVYSIASEDIKELMDFYNLVGCRRSEALTIKKEDLTEAGMKLYDSKTNRRFIVKWNPELRALTDRIKIRNAKAPISGMYLFNTSRGRQRDGHGVTSIFRRLIKKAMSLKLISDPFQLRDIRAKVLTEVYRKEGITEAANVGGHTTEKTTEKHYIRGEKKLIPRRTK
jgi:integrase